MKTLYLLFFSCILATALQAQIIHVPADYPTIQQGIKAAAPGDTVLVAEGTYYEQINFLGKKPLVVASQFIKDADTSHISKTIIDGSQLTNIDSASVVYFISGEDTTSILCGFTVMHGMGTQSQEGINKTRIGGGVFIDSSGAKLINNHITENYLTDSLHGNVQLVFGAGLVTQYKMNDHWVVVNNNVIDHNSCYSAGIEVCAAGLEIDYNCRITNNIISDNVCTGKATAYAIGSGISCFAEPAWLKQVTRIVQHNTIKNNRAESQNKWADGAAGFFQAVSGIFSDNEVTGNQAHGSGNNGDVGGLGFYEPKDGFVIRNNTFRENSGSQYGGIFMEAYDNLNSSMLLIENNYFVNNESSQHGGAFATIDVPVKLQNNVFSNNLAANNGGAIYLKRNSNNKVVHLGMLINNSLYGNTATTGGGLYSYNAKPLVFNSIFWSDSAKYGKEIYTTNQVEMANTTINPAYITGTVIDGGGNLNQDPMFADTVLLTLSTSSSCLNKGTLAFTTQGGETVNCPLYDITGASRPQGTTVDMGAYEYDTIVGIEDYRMRMSDFGLVNYPNPFMGSTTFTYTLPESTKVRLQVFNNLGLLVAEPVNEFRQNGEHKVTWNSEGLPAGIYYCRLQAGEQVNSVKIVKMK